MTKTIRTINITGGVLFLNTVFTNGLIRTRDGCNLSIKVTNSADLYRYCFELFRKYNYQ